MTKPYTRYIKDKTKYLLWAKAAGRCELNGHNKILWRDDYTKKEMNFAEVAHIIGNSLRGPRGKPNLPPQYCNDIQNLMLVCLDCHKLIDDEPENYPDDLLRNTKEAHERRIEAQTSIDRNRTSNVIKYGANIEAHNAVINTQDAHHAMALSGWFPARAKPIRLGLVNSTMQDHEQEYWLYQVRELERQFARNVQPYIDEGYRNHFSIFALAPIPLLIKLGSLLSDVHPAEVYQLHREPQQIWVWQDGPEYFEYIVEEPITSYETVALIIALSDRVREARIHRVLGEEGVSIWKLTIAEPDKDFLKSRGQLQLFRETFRKLLGDISYKHGGNVVIHLFPAMPVATAVEVGRVRQPKPDLPLVIYDENITLGGFIETISIGELPRRE